MITTNIRKFQLFGQSADAYIKSGMVLVLALFLSSCVIQPVVESYRDPDVDYKKYKTFTLISNYPNKKKEGVLEEKLLFSIVRTNMEKRGFSYRKKKEDSDFSVKVVFANRYVSDYIQEKTIYSANEYYVFQRSENDERETHIIAPIRMPQTYGGYREDYFQVYAEINFYDSKTDRKIWKGSGLYRAETYDKNITAPPLISTILDRFRKLLKIKK